MSNNGRYKATLLLVSLMAWLLINLFQFFQQDSLRRML